MATVRPPKGMRDILPDDVRKRRAVLDVIRKEVTSRGFFEIETPSVESISNLKSKQGGENESLIFEILRRGLDASEPVKPSEAIDLGLRYDLTLPLSRYYANNAASLPAVFRSFQTGHVFRAERPQKGRFRQFQQCDIDIVGAEGAAPEIEVLACGWSVITALGIDKDSHIIINDRRLLEWLLRQAGVDERDYLSVMISLDKRDKIGVEGVRKECQELANTDAEAIDTLLEAIDALCSAYDSQTLELTGQISVFDESVPLFNLPIIIESLHAINPDIRIVFDPTLVRGMGYYTGTIFEVKHTSTASSICGGGRYDDMIGNLGGKSVPAVGFSFGFERLVETIDVVDTHSGQAVAIAYRSDDEYMAAIGLREQLLSQFAKASLTRMPKKPKKTYFDDLVADGFELLIMPEFVGASADEAIAGAKKLVD